MMSQIEISSFKSPVGELLIGSVNDTICICDWQHRKMRKAIDNRVQKGLKADYKEGVSDIAKQCILQLESYFHGELQEFDLPLTLVGSDFQKQVWGQLIKVPFGTTESYLGLAQRLNNEGAIRAVAAANGANCISIVVPCHRIIGSNGDLTGYAGGLGAKKKLLQLEGSYPYQTSLFED
ncbi:MAG: methylated-DNA--[protein]-cysteine S-methyltransferase [Reichenbachiella sp.]